MRNEVSDLQILESRSLIHICVCAHHGIKVLTTHYPHACFLGYFHRILKRTSFRSRYCKDCTNQTYMLRMLTLLPTCVLLEHYQHSYEAEKSDEASDQSISLHPYESRHSHSRNPTRPNTPPLPRIYFNSPPSPSPRPQDWEKRPCISRAAFIPTSVYPTPTPGAQHLIPDILSTVQLRLNPHPTMQCQIR